MNKVRDVEVDPKDTYYALNEECLRNGSFIRFTGRKRERLYANYILGDFHGFIDELPDREFQKWSAKEGKKLLPKSMF